MLPMRDGSSYFKEEVGVMEEERIRRGCGCMLRYVIYLFMAHYGVI